MATAPLMRTTSAPVQPHLAHHNAATGISSFGRSRSSGSLHSHRSVHLVGWERRRAASASLQRVQSEASLVGSDGGVALYAHRTGTAKAEEGLEEGMPLGFGIRSGVGLAVLEEAGGGAGSGWKAGGSGGGSGRGGGKDGREGTGGGRSEMGAYYQEMLEADPANPLLLRNYGKFLHEVEGDVAGAEQCYGRAILASPGDGEVLSLYGKLIWDAHRDESRAGAYFERAVEASPEDCYVLGSYAHFLWDAEEEEEEEEEETSSPTTSPPSQQHRPPPPPPHLVRAY